MTNGKKKILALIDFSSTTKKVVDMAIEQARGLGGDILLLHIEDPEPDFVGYEPGPQVQRDSVAKKIHSNHEKIQELEKEIKKIGIKAEAFLVQGPIVDKILSESEKLKADLIVLGSHGHSAMYHLMLGSVSQGVIKGAARPVLLIPSSKEHAKKRRQ